ncbi:hypothetical protein ACIRSS_28615 [Amycolatopsis sp. NPDC101161]|uniref:hypothetical protein n=1 Tax=Amycolatopsis sp. NPDC101161 TaxID=3363940 RepID=UPI0037F3995E
MTRLICSAIGALALLGAVLVMLLPLPPQDLGVLEGPLYCGPGASSNNTLQMMVDPDAVNRDDSAASSAGRSTPEERQAEARRAQRNVQICQGAAKSRFVWAVALLIAAVAVGLAVPSIAGAARRRPRAR